MKGLFLVTHIAINLLFTWEILVQTMTRSCGQNHVSAFRSKCVSPTLVLTSVYRLLIKVMCVCVCVLPTFIKVSVCVCHPLIKVCVCVLSTYKSNVCVLLTFIKVSVCVCVCVT